MATRISSFLLVAIIALTTNESQASAQESGKAASRAPGTPTVMWREASESREAEVESPFADAIETDRDSFTPSTKTAGLHRLIFESAYSFVDNRRTKETHSFPEMLVRYGLTECLELRVGWNYEVGGGGADVSGAGAGEEESTGGLERESRISYGLKLRLTEQRGWLPNSAAILQAFTPTSGPSAETEVTATYVLGWELANEWLLDAAIRYGTSSEEQEDFDVWAPSIVLKVPLQERFNVHAEYFSIRSAGKAEEFTKHYLSPGAHFLLTPDLEIGVRVGWGLNDDSARFFVNAGVGWRF